ncbi:glutathione peroxidase [Amaricoccus macauensis]|uniref:glutathione peroxidase n=1 Tax=Amaricoccus macauensis TaxID=57001 RepID=UPI003C7CE1B3
MRRLLFALLLAGLSTGVEAGAIGARFDSIDGEVYALEEWRGRPVFVVNTASRCGFAHQFEGLQTLYDTYRDRGLVVLAIPSNDFRQELATEAEVKEFCEVNFFLDMPMTMITEIRGEAAHPFYRAVRDETGFEPSWNFNKVLIGPDGEVVETWGATTEPLAPEVIARIEELLD